MSGAGFLLPGSLLLLLVQCSPKRCIECSNVQNLVYKIWGSSQSHLDLEKQEHTHTHTHKENQGFILLFVPLLLEELLYHQNELILGDNVKQLGFLFKDFFLL